MSFRDFMQIALYTPEIGYYTKPKTRVGQTEKSDFFTAYSLGPIFPQLILNAAQNLLGQVDLSEYTFVEIGAEPNQSLLDGLAHAFGSVLSYSQGSALHIPLKSVVFANEILDAQPFHRLIFKNGKWQEIGVKIENNTLQECLLETPSPELADFFKQLPPEIAEGYILDIALEAESWIHSIVSQSWNGLILLFDYGKTWQELISACPQGTARAYYRHQKSNDLLANPGDQDLTCHVCWDRIEAVLKTHTFQQCELQRQEAFLMHHSKQVIEKVIQDKPNTFDPNRQALMQLLHPAHMGHSFQVLWGIRDTDSHD